MKEKIFTILRKFRPAHLLAALFLVFMAYVGAAALPGFLINTGKALQNPTDPLGYIRKINDQYSGMLETEGSPPLLQHKGSYIDLNGFMANLLGQPMMNDRVTLKNGHLASLVSKTPDPDDIQNAADNIIRFADAHRKNGGELLFVMVSSQISKYEDLLPTGYTDTTNATADAFLSLLEAAQIPFLDLREEMHKEGMSVTDAYFATDHHWKPQTGLWACGKILEKLQKMGAMEPVEPFYTDPGSYTFETYKNTFLGSSGKRTGRFYAGTDDSIVLKPNFETEISLSIPFRDLELTGRFEDVAYNRDAYHNYENPDFYNENVYGLYGWGDMPISRWRNEKAPVDQKFLLIGESFGNIPFSLMSLCISSCDEVDLRHFEEDFPAYYDSYQPDTVIILVNVDNTLSEFTDSYLD